MSARFFFISFLIFLGSCTKQVVKKSTLLDFIPNTPTAIISAPSIESLKNNLSENEFISKFSSTKTYTKIQQEFKFLDSLSSDTSVLISYAIVGKELEYVFTSKSNPKGNTLEYSTEKINYNNTTYQKLKNYNAYALVLNNTLIISSSALLIENLIRNHINKSVYTNPTLKKLFRTSDSGKLNFYINTTQQPAVITALLPMDFLGHSEWLSLEMDAANSLFLNGIATSIETTHSFAQKLSNTNPEKSAVSIVIPENFNTYTSFNFSEIIQESTNTLIDNSTEVTKITEGSNTIWACRLLNTDVSTELTIFSNYRNTPIYKNTAFTFPESITIIQPKYACYIDEFLVFSSEVSTLENCISHYKNNTSLAQHEYFIKSQKALLKEVHITQNSRIESVQKTLANALNDPSILKTSLSNFPLAIQQITYEDNHTQFNYSIQQVLKNKGKAPRISQLKSISLDAAPVSNIQWVTNHHSKQKELIVQDKQHMLYLISNKGVILWRKQLNSKIQGKIHQVDLYKNKKLQFAFTTENEFMVLDRNGVLVDPFYKAFSSNNLLPLAVFDYDNNRNYRFIISQGKRVYMYNNRFKKVKGFQFKKTKSNILQTPIHMVKNTKDYIVIPEENGTIHIINRQGKSRTSLKNTYAFNRDTKCYENTNGFSFKDANNYIYHIDIRTGKSQKKTVLQAQTSTYTHYKKTTVVLEDNNLTINNNTISLDYGNYTSPKIIDYKNNTYINITDKDTQKSYLYTTKGLLIDQFPVYGKSSISLTNMNHDAALEFAIEGENNSILIYGMN